MKKYAQLEFQCFKDKAKVQAIKEKMTMQKWLEKIINESINKEFTIDNKEYLNNYYSDKPTLKVLSDCKELEE